MPALSEILKEMNDNVKVQFLHESSINVKDKKRTNDTEITFATNEVDTTSFFSGNKVGMVIWFDVDEYNKAITNLKGKQYVYG